MAVGVAPTRRPLALEVYNNSFPAASNKNPAGGGKLDH